MGFANFYHHFIQNFSKITRSISDILKGDPKVFRITNEYQEAFRHLKKTFTSAPILHYFILDFSLIVETDASDFALRKIVLQHHEDCLHPVPFHSAEVNYEVYDKEMLAIVYSLKQLGHYLEEAKHTIMLYTDHKNLEYFLMTRSLNHCQARWVELLANYDFTIVYLKGASNSKADAISRCSKYRHGEGDGQLK